MHRQHLDADILETPGQLLGIPVGIAPAGTHLQRDRHIEGACGLDHGLGNLHGQRLVLHQGGARPFVADLLGRAAHVDVDDLGAAFDVVDGCFGHHGGIGAGNLHGNRTGLTRVVGAAAGLEAVPQVFARCDHLADRIARTQSLAQLAERPVRHTRHGSDKQAICQSVLANAKGRHAGEKETENAGRKEARLYLPIFSATAALHKSTNPTSGTPAVPAPVRRMRQPAPRAALNAGAAAPE